MVMAVVNVNVMYVVRTLEARVYSFSCCHFVNQLFKIPKERSVSKLTYPNLPLMSHHLYSASSLCGSSLIAYDPSYFSSYPSAPNPHENWTV